MKILPDEFGNLILTEVYGGVVLETREGNRVAICMRDDTVELNVVPVGTFQNNWWRVDMQEGTIAPLHESDNAGPPTTSRRVTMHDHPRRMPTSGIDQSPASTE